jgi:hypothetical protein
VAIRFEHADYEETMLNLIDLLGDWLSDRPELKRTFAIWIRALLLRHSKRSLELPEINDLKELRMSLTDRFETWAKQYEQKGLAKGIEKGIEKGEALLLQRLLVRRFGVLPATILKQIAHATTDQLELWGDRVLDAQSLDEVFRS